MTATQDILSPAARAPAPRPHLSPLQGSDLNALRGVLLARERAQITQILHRLDDPATRAEELARVLPHAIARRSLDDPALAEALRPAIRDALACALREQPELLLGAVRVALIDLMLKPWRLLAAALRRLRFARRVAAGSRIEELLLIDRSSGELLQQSNLVPIDPENPVYLRQRRTIDALLGSLRSVLQDPDNLCRYLALGHLRVEGFTYGIHATETLLLLSVIRASDRCPPNELLQECKDLLARIDSAAPVLPPLPLAFPADEAGTSGGA